MCIRDSPRSVSWVFLLPVGKDRIAYTKYRLKDLGSAGRASRHFSRNRDVLFHRGIDKGSFPVEQATGDRAVPNGNGYFGIRNLLPDHRKFFLPSRGISAYDKENICLTGVVMDKDAILFDIVAGCKACLLYTS